jgi:hypothetical protein
MSESATVGFVILGETKIYVSIRQFVSCRWIQAQERTKKGARLEELEAALRRIPGARGKLLKGKTQVLP